MEVIQFPLSPNYCSSWDAEKALVELVANSLDASTQVTLTYKDGKMLIQDRGTGFPKAAFVLGYTTKLEQAGAIGQFGEGLNIAALVLCRLGIPMVGETRFGPTAYSFVPRLYWDERLGMKLLEMVLSTSKLRQGTRIEVQVDHDTFLKVKGRFLHFRRDYRPTPYPGRILPNRPAGEIYLGGLLVSKLSNFCFAYDLSLRYKKAQDRDRSMLNEDVRRQAIGQVVATCASPALVEKLLQAGKSGKANEAEMNVWDLSSQARVAWHEVGRRLQRNKQLVVVPGEAKNAEKLLFVKDRGFAPIMPTGKHSWALGRFYDLMGIPSIDRVLEQRPEEETEWVSLYSLNTAQRHRLNLAKRRMVTCFGPDILGEVRVYEKTTFIGNCSAQGVLGFYKPDGDTIGISLKALATSSELTTTLIHEAAHRKAKLMGRDHLDRSQDFETTLGEMAAKALLGRQMRAAPKSR